MKFTVWQKEPKAPPGRALARGVEALDITLVHWTDDHECRAITLQVDAEGNVTVEHSTVESGEPAAGIGVEQITRVTVPGWGE